MQQYNVKTAEGEFQVWVEADPDAGFCVSVPGLDGCVAQGDTLAESLANIVEAIELHLASDAP